jgi:Cys-rich protein (TIGR01571 family)
MNDSTIDLTSSWSTQMCSPCSEPGGLGLYFRAAFCMPCVAGETFAKLKPDDHMCGGNCVGGALCVSIPFLSVIGHCTLRSAIRKKYTIDGSIFEDFFCAHTLCGLIQVPILSLDTSMLLLRQPFVRYYKLERYTYFDQ